jgi:CheY-like chemotaxis protein
VSSTLPAPVVLVVDDEREVRELFVQVLNAHGMQCVEAPTAEHAWALLENGLVPSAVLLDLQMPGMGGLGFLLQLRADPRYSALPVTIATGDFYIAQTTRAAVEALGAAVSFKPLAFDEILSLARQMIDSPAIGLPSTSV